MKFLSYKCPLIGEETSVTLPGKEINKLSRCEST